MSRTHHNYTRNGEASANSQQNRVLAVSTLDALIARPALSSLFSHIDFINTEVVVAKRQPQRELFCDSLHNHLYREAWLQARLHLQEYHKLEYSGSELWTTMQVSPRDIVLGLLRSLHPVFWRHMQDLDGPPLPEITQEDAATDELSDSFIAYLQVLRAEESARRAVRHPHSSYVGIDERVDSFRRHFFPPVPEPSSPLQTCLETTLLSAGLAILEHLIILHTCACELLDSEQSKCVSIPVQSSSANEREYRDREADLDCLSCANLSLYKSIGKLQSFLTHLIIVRLVVEVDQASTTLSSCQDLFRRCCNESRGEAESGRLRMMLQFFVNMQNRQQQQLTQSHSDSNRMHSSNEVGGSDISTNQLATILQFPGALDMFIHHFTQAHDRVKRDEVRNGDLSDETHVLVSCGTGNRLITSRATGTLIAKPSCIRSTVLTESGRNIPHLHIQLPVNSKDNTSPTVPEHQRDCGQQGHDEHVDF